MKIQYVPPEYTAQTWPRVEKFFLSALRFSQGDYTIDQIKMFVNIGQWLLIVAVDDAGEIHGAATSSFINYPNDRVAFITAVGGRLVTEKETMQQMFELLKSRGATKVQGMARPSIERLWRRHGFNTVSALVEYKL